MRFGVNTNILYLDNNTDKFHLNKHNNKNNIII